MSSLDYFDVFLQGSVSASTLKQHDHLWQGLLVIRLLGMGIEPHVDSNFSFRINETETRRYYPGLGLHFTSKEIVRNPSQFTSYLRTHSEHLEVNSEHQARHSIIKRTNTYSN